MGRTEEEEGTEEEGTEEEEVEKVKEEDIGKGRRVWNINKYM
jgi:hypothetical protein